MAIEILEYQVVRTDPDLWVIARGIKDCDYVFMTLRRNTEQRWPRIQMRFQLAGQYVSMSPYVAHLYKLIGTWPGLGLVISYDRTYFVRERVFPDNAIVLERDWSRRAPGRYLLTIMLKPHAEQVLVSRESLLAILSEMMK